MVLQTTNLRKDFGTFTALQEVNLQLSQGEVLGFIGPNGAGKTTTIRVILGILKATEGQASVFGLDSWSDSVEIHKRVAYVPGDVNLWNNLTGGEVIDLFTSLRGEKPNTAKRAELIEKFALDPTKKCRTYSKGNRQKVALIAAFASNADLYILDEPTSGLDPLMEQVFQACVLEKKREGKSILLSSHILSEVERLCDRMAIIRDGKIVESGTLADMRRLTRVNMYIESEKVIDYSKIDGIFDLSAKEKGFAFQVDSSAVGAVVSELSRHGILKIECTPMALEDLFMRHYDSVSSGNS